MHLHSLMHYLSMLLIDIRCRFDNSFKSVAATRTWTGRHLVQNIRHVWLVYVSSQPRHGHLDFVFGVVHRNWKVASIPEMQNLSPELSINLYRMTSLHRLSDRRVYQGHIQVYINNFFNNICLVFHEFDFSDVCPSVCLSDKNHSVVTGETELAGLYCISYDCILSLYNTCTTNTLTVVGLVEWGIYVVLMRMRLFA